jgi:hypothetical protein
MYAAIMSERDVALTDVKDEIIKMGFQVVGSELEDLEEPPRNVLLWIMFGVNRLSFHPNLPCKYVRVASLAHSGRRGFFRVIGCPWWSAVFYRAWTWLGVTRDELKHRLAQYKDH